MRPTMHAKNMEVTLSIDIELQHSNKFKVMRRKVTRHKDKRAETDCSPNLCASSQAKCKVAQERA